MDWCVAWADDRKPLPRAPRCLEDELLPDVAPLPPPKGKTTGRSERRREERPSKAMPPEEAERRRRRTQSIRQAQERAAKAAAGERIGFRLWPCLWCTANTRSPDRCCSKRSCQAAAAVELAAIAERRAAREARRWGP